MKTLFSGNSNSSSRSEKPWHNEYARRSNLVDSEYIVEQVIKCQQGLLLITSEFKDFVFEGQQAYPFLLEAIEYFLEKPKESVPIILKVTSSKSADIGTIEEYEGSGVWIKDKKGYRFLEAQESTPSSQVSNPFIPPTSTTRKKKQS